MAQATRRDARLCAALRVQIAGSGNEAAVTRNLSGTGLFLVTRQRWPQGTTLKLTLHHRFTDVDIFARVVRSQADGVGFVFVEPSHEQAVQLRQIIDSLLADGAWYDDRRCGVRTEVHGPVVWRLGAVERQSEIQDLSSGGAFIATNEPPEMGSHILLYLPAVTTAGKTAAPEVLGCQATVVHRSENGFGVAFVFPSSAFRESVDQLTRSAGL